MRESLKQAFRKNVATFGEGWTKALPALCPSGSRWSVPIVPDDWSNREGSHPPSPRSKKAPYLGLFCRCWKANSFFRRMWQVRGRDGPKRFLRFALRAPVGRSQSFQMIGRTARVLTLPHRAQKKSPKSGAFLSVLEGKQFLSPNVAGPRRDGPKRFHALCPSGSRWSVPIVPDDWSNHEGSHPPSPRSKKKPQIWGFFVWR